MVLIKAYKFADRSWAALTLRAISKRKVVYSLLCIGRPHPLKLFFTTNVRLTWNRRSFFFIMLSAHHHALRPGNHIESALPSLSDVPNRNLRPCHVPPFTQTQDNSALTFAAIWDPEEGMTSICGPHLLSSPMTANFPWGINACEASSGCPNNGHSDIDSLGSLRLRNFDAMTHSHGSFGHEYETASEGEDSEYMTPISDSPQNLPECHLPTSPSSTLSFAAIWDPEEGMTAISGPALLDPSTSANCQIWVDRRNVSHFLAASNLEAGSGSAVGAQPRSYVTGQPLQSPQVSSAPSSQHKSSVKWSTRQAKSYHPIVRRNQLGKGRLARFADLHCGLLSSLSHKIMSTKQATEGENESESINEDVFVDALDRFDRSNSDLDFSSPCSKTTGTFSNTSRYKGCGASSMNMSINANCGFNSMTSVGHAPSSIEPVNFGDDDSAVIIDEYGHPDCEPHLPSRFSVTTTSTSNYLHVDFASEVSSVNTSRTRPLNRRVVRAPPVSRLPPELQEMSSHPPPSPLRNLGGLAGRRRASNLRTSSQSLRPYGNHHQRRSIASSLKTLSMPRFSQTFTKWRRSPRGDLDDQWVCIEIRPVITERLVHVEY